MANKMEDRLWAYLNMFRGIMKPAQMLEGTLLITEVKAANPDKDLDRDSSYEAMLVLADKLQVRNPFTDPDAFFQAYQQIDGEPDWEDMMYRYLGMEGFYMILTPTVLMKEMASHIGDNSKKVMIAEGEKFVPNLKATVDEHPNCMFTVTTQSPLYETVFRRIFSEYNNVTVANSSIYQYGFLDEKFDLILSVPNFAGRALAEDDTNFICRDTEMVALENLLLHLSSSGELVIVMPGKITFASGRVNDLREFIMQMYKMEEISELPEGIFQNTGIKTYLLVVGVGRTEDVVIRKYSAVGRKTKRGPVKEMGTSADSFAMLEEFEEIGDWNIDKLLTQQDEEFMKYQASDMRKTLLGDVAEIFRGKAVSKKQETGSIGVVNISNIGQYELDYETLDKLDEEDRKVANYILKEGDVLLPARGTAIRTAVFHEQLYPCIASANVIVIRPNPKMLDSTYLKIFIDSPIGNSMISSLQQGMTVMNISYKDLKMLEIPFPVLEEQQRISKQYTDSYKEYINSVSAAEKRWQETLSKLQTF